jgi:hypothetical protein
LLRAVDVADLPQPLRARRLENLDRLHAYRLARRFPDGEEPSDGRRPTFIDDRGRRCAVAALVEESEGSAAAFAIDRRFHHAYVAEIDDPAFEAWVASSGFSRAELAIVQPTYEHRPPPFWGAPTRLEPRVALAMLSSVDGAHAHDDTAMEIAAASLELGGPRAPFARWIAVFDGSLGRFPGNHALLDADLRAGACHDGALLSGYSWWLGTTVGAGVDAVSAVAPAALTVPVDAFLGFTHIGNQNVRFPPREGFGVELRGRVDPVVLGRAPELLWTGALDLIWFYTRHDGDRYTAYLTLIARELAGTTWAGAGLGGSFEAAVRRDHDSE